jgi:Kef-type K+ transport system membrane component KefB
MHIPRTTLIYLATVFGLLVLPQALQRFRLPAPLTCFAMGVAVAVFFRSYIDDNLLKVIATFGIASLFLFAGLEVDLNEIRRQLPRILGDLAVAGLILLLAMWLLMRYMHMPWQTAALFGLGVFTPSTGFILDTLPHSGLKPEEQTEVSLGAISGEIMALLVLFFVSQAGSVTTLAISSGALILLIVLTPLLFLALGRWVVPYAPGSEFSLLIMVGIICAVISEHLGLHVLMGAFVAGLVAGMLRQKMTTLASHENLHAVRLFASFFIPFYFFQSGLEVPTGALVLKAVLYGIALVLIVTPVRIAKNWAQARFVSKRSMRGGFRVALALTPTLIFTLVIAGILRERFHLDDALFGGMLIYAAITTILPAFMLPGLASVPTP